MPTPRSDSVRVLSRALDQTGDLLTHVREDQLADPTPCRDWVLGKLIDHLVADVRRFRVMVEGEQPDWAATPEPIRDEWAETFREGGDDLVHAWHQLADAEPGPSPDMQVAELAVHTWDLATALGRRSDRLDPEVAEVGLAYMRANLTDELRGDAFGPEQPAPENADPYQRLAAFAGRSV